MTLPNNFTFSQNNLQDYLDCPRRFELRHMLRQEWPAVESEPYLEMEHRADVGRQFHRLVQQAVAGLPLDALSEQAAEDADLSRWWDSFLRANPLADLPAFRQSELYLQTPFAGFHLVGKYDLVAVEPGQQAVIFDWKTSPKRTPRSILAERMQTRVYPLLLVLAGNSLNGGNTLAPEQVSLHYWFPEYPDHPEVFTVTSSSLEQDSQSIEALIREINAQSHSPWLLVNDPKCCKFCNYRSLCGRGERAGNGLEEDLEIETSIDLSDLDLDQIGEISL